MKLNSKNKDLLLEKIDILEKNNKKEDAISDYSKLIQLDGKDGLLFYKRGLLYQQLGKKKDAERDFSQAKALGIKAENDEINTFDIDTKKEPVAAIKQEEKQTAQNIQNEQKVPEQKQVYEQQVTDNNKLQELKQMNENELKANTGKINASASMIHLNRGNISFRKQKYEEAISELNKAVSFNYKDPQCYLLRAEAYMGIKNFDYAIKDLLMVIELSPKATFAYSKIADIYKMNNNFEQAKSFYTKAIEINPKYASAYFGLAEIYERNKQIDLAVEKYKEAAKLDVKLAKECNIKIAELNN